MISTTPMTHEELIAAALKFRATHFDSDDLDVLNLKVGEAGDLIRRLAAALQAAPPPGEGWRREHRFGAPPEPMSRPDEDWCDEYAAWFHAHPVFTHDHQI